MAIDQVIYTDECSAVENKGCYHLPGIQMMHTQHIYVFHKDFIHD